MADLRISIFELYHESLGASTDAGIGSIVERLLPSFAMWDVRPLMAREETPHG
jgi:hypothetical protein